MGNLKKAKISFNNLFDVRQIAATEGYEAVLAFGFLDCNLNLPECQYEYSLTKVRLVQSCGRKYTMTHRRAVNTPTTVRAKKATQHRVAQSTSLFLYKGSTYLYIDAVVTLFVLFTHPNRNTDVPTDLLRAHESFSISQILTCPMGQGCPTTANWVFMARPLLPFSTTARRHVHRTAISSCRPTQPPPSNLSSAASFHQISTSPPALAPSISRILFSPPPQHPQRSAFLAPPSLDPSSHDSRYL